MPQNPFRPVAVHPKLISQVKPSRDIPVGSRRKSRFIGFPPAAIRKPVQVRPSWRQHDLWLRARSRESRHQHATWEKDCFLRHGLSPCTFHYGTALYKARHLWRFSVAVSPASPSVTPAKVSKTGRRTRKPQAGILSKESGGNLHPDSENLTQEN